MARAVTEVTIFVASPGDVVEERNALEQVITGINRVIARDLGYTIQLVRWEDAIPGVANRTQEVILEQVKFESIDLFIGILWNRFGRPTGAAKSGTHEEFMIAYDLWKRYGRPHIMMYFCDRPSTLTTVEETRQRLRVLDFKHQVSGIGVYKEYRSTEEFKNLTQLHIMAHLIAHSNNRGDADRMRMLSTPSAEPVSRWRTSEDIVADMVCVEAGTCFIGAESVPASIDSNYYIDKYPVTNEEFYEFMLSTGYMLSNDSTQLRHIIEHVQAAVRERPRHPVVDVTWYDAQAYAAWRGKRLPTVLEWERAARGPIGLAFPWGNEFDVSRCNCAESKIGETTPIDAYPNGVSAAGCWDMAGNVFEWVQDWSQTPRFTSRPFTEKVNKSASFGRSERDMAMWCEESDPPDLRMGDVGFRCAYGPVNELRYEGDSSST